MISCDRDCYGIVYGFGMDESKERIKEICIWY